MNRTHVSYGGYLQKVVAVAPVAPYGSRFVSYGRLVNPRGHYDGAPRVALWQTNAGFIAVH